MGDALWNALPETTNAEESMHWQFYQACGRKHPTLVRFNALFKLSLYYEQKYNAALSKLFTSLINNRL